MTRLAKFALPLGGVAIAGLLVLTAPKAAQAVAAALVQVTNTASNPVIIQDIGQQASQMVHLECTGSPGTVPYCNAYASNGSALDSDNSYTVPANQFLVITSVDLTSSYSPIAGSSDGPCPSASFAVLETTISPYTYYINEWTLSANAPTTHFTYPPGLAVGPGMRLSGLTIGTVKCGLVAEIHGYLTAN